MPPALPDRAAAALFFLPAARLAEALGRLPPGRLWRLCLPGMNPAAALHALGANAGATLLQTAVAFAGKDGGALAAAVGLPFALDTAGDLAPLGEALLADARRLATPVGAAWDDGGFIAGPACPPPAGVLPAALAARPVEFRAAADGRCRLEIRHAGRQAWEAAALACLDQAADDALSGRPLDPVDALLVAPGVDLRPLLGLADSDARLRFVEALADAEGPGEPRGRFARSPFRRSAAAGLAQAARAALEALPGGRTGRDAEGWPAAWHACAPDVAALLRGVPEAVLAAAAAVRVAAPLPGGA